MRVKIRMLLGAAACLLLAGCALKMPPFGADILTDAARDQIPGRWSGPHRRGPVVPNWIRTFHDPELTRLVLRLVRDPATPTRYRVGLVALGAWLAFPIDIIPDFLPVIGVLDDIVLAALVLRWVGRGLGIERIEAAWPGSPEGLAILRRALDSRSS